jgi:hypothetical protein
MHKHLIFLASTSIYKAEIKWPLLQISTNCTLISFLCRRRMLCKLISLCNRANGERRQSDADPVRLNEIRHLFYKKKTPAFCIVFTTRTLARGLLQRKGWHHSAAPLRFSSVVCHTPRWLGCAPPPRLLEPSPLPDGLILVRYHAASSSSPTTCHRVIGPPEPSSSCPHLHHHG